MNFLELCQKVASESGITATGPTSVSGQTGILSKVISWVRQADLEVQLERSDWSFLWKTTQSVLVVNEREYLQADLGASDINIMHLAFIGGREAEVLDWTHYVSLYRKTGKQDQTANVPSVITRAPNGKFIVFPVPLTACAIEIDYSAEPAALVNNLDISTVPVKFHYAIVEKALMKYAEHEEDGNRYNQARLNYLDWLNVMGRDSKPKMKFLNE